MWIQSPDLALLEIQVVTSWARAGIIRAGTTRARETRSETTQTGLE